MKGPQFINSEGFFLDDMRLVIGNKDKLANIWDSNREIGESLKGHLSMVTSVCFSKEGTLIVTGSSGDSSIKV